MAIKLIITGENADEIYQQLMNMAKVPDFCYNPWEYNNQGKVIGHNDNVIEEKGTVYAPERVSKEDSKPADTIEPDNHNYTQAAPAAKPDPVPAAQKEPDYISLQDLQKKCMELGEAYSPDVFTALKAKMGFVSMAKDLDPAGRQKFADMIDQYITDHPKG